VLDLFAGAGTLGLEALSRGVDRAIFIDHARAACLAIRDNLRRLGMAESSEVHCADVLRALPRLDGVFDWIFVDPPYASDLAERTLARLGGAPDRFAPDAVVVVEHDRRREPAETHGCLVKADCRRYGDTELTFFSPSAA
jgi:16S rRNA (guanine966-N2)-methyltransferase